MFTFMLDLVGALSLTTCFAGLSGAGALQCGASGVCIIVFRVHLLWKVHAACDAPSCITVYETSHNNSGVVLDVLGLLPLNVSLTASTIKTRSRS